MLALLWECLIGLIVRTVAKFLMPGKIRAGFSLPWHSESPGPSAPLLGRAIGWHSKKGSLRGS